MEPGPTGLPDVQKGVKRSNLVKEPDFGTNKKASALGVGGSKLLFFLPKDFLEASNNLTKCLVR